MPDHRETFNAVADLYDAVRPGYPAELFEDLLELARLRPGERVLEVGCGTGQATRDFANRGLRVTAIDPGTQLIDIARRRFEGVPGVEFVVGRFEDYSPDPGAFRLVASAQAWHWVDPQIGFARAAAAVGERGAIAIFGHVPGPLPADVQAALAPLYAEHAPQLRGPAADVWYEPAGPVRPLIEGYRLFGPVSYRCYAWRQALTPAGLVQWLRTRSDYNILPPERRDPLLRGIEGVLAAGWREVEIDNATHLYFAPRL